MNDARAGEVQPREALHPLPGPTLATSLTAAAEHVEPLTSDLVDETSDAVAVAGDGVVIQPALHNTSQPAGRLAQRPFACAFAVPL